MCVAAATREAWLRRILFDLLARSSRKPTKFSVDATNQFVGWREGFLRPPTEEKPTTVLSINCFPVAGRCALAAGCHARQLGNIHLGTGAVVRPLAGRILVNTAVFSSFRPLDQDAEYGSIWPLFPACARERGHEQRGPCLVARGRADGALLRIARVKQSFSLHGKLQA